MYKDKILMRELFLRNGGYCEKKYNMPVIYKETIDLSNIKLIGCHNTRKKDRKHYDCGVHFYKWDDKLTRYYNHPFKYLNILRQYRFALTPDFSLFLRMNPNVQRMHIFMGRWIGNFNQRNGIHVIPSAGWGGKETFAWCNAGLPENATIAVSTLGTFKENKTNFLDGYFNLIEQKSPELILCYGGVHPEMHGTSKIIQCIHEAELAKREAEFERDKRLYERFLFDLEELGNEC